MELDNMYKMMLSENIAMLCIISLLSYNSTECAGFFS